MICFYDTNVLVYAVDAHEPVKRKLALARYQRDCTQHTIAISTQVLIEFYNTVCLRFRPAMPTAEALIQLEQLSVLRVIEPNARSVLEAIRIHQTHQTSWWNALIIEAALRANADVLVTEDLQHGRQFGRLRVENPFIDA